jgi:hypothetical protein
MATIDEFVKRQKDGATFVITAPMLRVKPAEFHALAQAWYDDGGPGFNVIGTPHRSVVDGEFFITRVTVIKTVSRAAAPRAAAPDS